METTTNGQVCERRRVAGPAAEANPLIAAITKLDVGLLADLDEEIKAAENYLAGLRAMRQVGGIALGLGAQTGTQPRVVTTTPVALLAVKAPPAPPTPAPPTPAPPTPAPPTPTNNKKPAGTLSGAVRAILAEGDISTDAVIDRLRLNGWEGTKGAMRATVYGVRKQLRSAKQPTPPPAQTQAEENSDETEADDEEADEEDNYAEAESRPSIATQTEFDCRCRLAETVFKRGLVSSRDLMTLCGLDQAAFDAAINHPWFERHMDKWRLTKLGKDEGLKDW